MAVVDDIHSALKGVIDPELGADVVDLGMIHGVRVEGTHADVDLALTIAECPQRGQLEEDTRRKARSVEGIETVTVHTTAMTGSQRSALMETARLRARERAAPTAVAPTTRVLAIASGKGGVGKSTTTVNLAAALGAGGRRVGILDADIWGFSIPRMLGTTDRITANEDRQLLPVDAQGLEVVSTGLIADSEETALMWRGLMLSKALEQFLTQTRWSALDYLLIDMPPGTGDVQMALSRLLPQAEMVVVTTPQRTAQKVAVRVADMARRSFMPIAGVVENMTSFVCDHGDEYTLFGSGGGDELAAELGVPVLGRIPLDTSLVEGGDAGKPAATHAPDGAAGRAFHALADRVLDAVPPAEATCAVRIDELLGSIPARPDPAPR